jgi:hypothetical protein
METDIDKAKRILKQEGVMTIGQILDANRKGNENNFDVWLRMEGEFADKHRIGNETDQEVYKRMDKHNDK